MPDPRRQRRMQLTVFLAVLAIPLAIGLWDRQAGVVAFLIGLFIAMRAIRVLRADAANSLLDDPSYQRLQQHQGERGRTIWVSLLDDQGQPLDAAAAERKLAQARKAAGPRDMVVGVRGKVEATDHPPPP
jgi:hypothetical protein